MCGIAGLLAFRGTSLQDAEADLPAVACRMARRGPDAEGTWSDGAACAFAFRRLAILDLSRAGDQPLLTDGGGHALVFNGELYNYRELRDRLDGLGWRSRSSGDAEVVLHALAEWGEGALALFNGMFALAFYEVRSQRLLLARDHAGIKPLHYLTSAKGVLFASRHDQLLAHRWAQGLEVSGEALHLYLRFGFVPAPWGLHRSTAQVQAGTWVRFEADGSTHRGRFFEFPATDPTPLSGRAADDLFEDALQSAVRRQMVADVPVGVFLSGGIDSPLVALEAQAQSTQPLNSFTIGSTDPAHDERAHALSFASGGKLSPHEVTLGPGDYLPLLHEAIDALGEPSADFSMMPTLAVSRLAAAHVKVALSGDGGDELFWGYPSRFFSAVLQSPLFAHTRVVRLAAIARRRLTGRGSATREALAGSLGELYRRKLTIVPDAWVSRLLPDLPRAPDLPELRSQASDPDAAAAFARRAEFAVHLPRVLAKVDLASMHHSLEVRVPLLDLEVIRAATRIDWADCLSVEAREGKRVLRRALVRRSGWETPGKRGFSMPLAPWLRGDARGLLNDVLAGRKALAGVPLHATSVQRLLRRLDAGDDSLAWTAYALLNLALWHDRRRAPRR